MKKFEDNEHVILLMTKKEATNLYNALVNTNTELDIVIKSGNGKECVTETDSTIAKECIKGIKALRYTLGDINPIAKMAKDYAYPKVYDNDTNGYDEIEALDENDFQMFCDELAKFGFTCIYNNSYDTFTIG